MDIISMPEVSIPQAKKDCPNANYIGDDFVLFDNIDDFNLPLEPVRMQCLFVALCTGGEAQYTVDTHKRKVGRGDVIIVNDGQVAADYEVNGYCQGIAMMMSRNFFSDIMGDVHELSSLFLFSRQHPVFHLNEEQERTFLGYLMLIRQKLTDTAHHFRRELVSSLLMALIYDMSNVIYLSQQTESTASVHTENIFAKFIGLVEENCKKERRVSWYAKQLGITPKYLAGISRAVSQRTPNEWIDRYVLIEICIMLKNTAWPMNKITKEMNFPNQSFFGKFFKSHVGVSPSRYRKRH